MKINVPFIYEALVIKPRCRKSSLIILKDNVEVEINEVSSSDLPVAFKIGETELRWDGTRLWDYDYHSVSRKPPVKVLASTIKENTEDAGKAYPYSCSGPKAPFNNFWYDTKDCMCSRHNTQYHGMRSDLNDKYVIKKEDAVFREWIDDNKDVVIENARKIAKALLICDGYMYAPVKEPRYVICTFGLGNNHGGTGMFIDQHYNSNIPNTSYFTALEYDKACSYADSIAEQRGDNKSIPVRTNCGHQIEVLITEAVKLNPAKEHGEGCEFINGIEKGINAAGPLGYLLAISKSL